MPPNWIGKSIGDLDIRKKYNINVMALKNNDVLNMDISSDTYLTGAETMLVLGEMKNVEKLLHM